MIMKKILLAVIVLSMASAFMYGQQDVTKFLGIPVDGFKHEMIQKLKEKGFVNSEVGDLEGEFNGTNVYVLVNTNNNKVWRICLVDKTGQGETAIKLRFNELCRQFENNDNYYGSSDQRIADDEDISYEMTVHDKRYIASFYQINGEGSMFDRDVWFSIEQLNGKYYIAIYYDNKLNRAKGEDL